MRQLLAACLSGFLAVATCSSVRKAELPSSKPAHAIEWVMLSSDMAPDCVDAAERAVAHLQAQGADFSVVSVEEDHLSFTEPRTGEVVVHAGIPKTHPRLAESYVWRARNGRTILRAEVVIGWCTPSVIAHELSHVLGMQDRVDYEYLMHPSDGLPWPLDPSERPLP